MGRWGGRDSDRTGTRDALPAHVLAAKAMLEETAKKASKEVNRIRDRLIKEFGLAEGAFGLTPDKIRSNPEFQAAKQSYSQAHEALRRFNSQVK